MIDTSIERTNFDYSRAFAESQSSNPTVISELIQAYNLIAQNLGISVFQFIQNIKSQGNDQQQAIYLATNLNSVRAKNALIGVAPIKSTPPFISREIAP